MENFVFRAVAMWPTDFIIDLEHIFSLLEI